MTHWNRATAWRQGSIVSHQTCVALNLPGADSDDALIAIVVTHDCDLAQDPAQEPEVEVITGRMVAQADGNCTHAKNPHLAVNATQFGEFCANAKRHVEKFALLPHHAPDPDFALTVEGRQTLQLWLASRYRRSAFPDEFDRRLSKESGLAERIAKILKKHGEHLTGIFFDVDDGEEITRHAADDTYQLRIFLLHPPDLIVSVADPAFQQNEIAANQAKDDISKAFTDKLFAPKQQWQYIELQSCWVISEEALTYQQFKQLKRWRFEHISLGSTPQQPALVE